MEKGLSRNLAFGLPPEFSLRTGERITLQRGAQIQCFCLVYNASVTPNWSLLVWKGPGLTVPGASLSGTKTNVLNIALGAPGEQNRLIQNITVSNTTSH